MNAMEPNQIRQEIVKQLTMSSLVLIIVSRNESSMYEDYRQELIKQLKDEIDVLNKALSLVDKFLNESQQNDLVQDEQSGEAQKEGVQ